MSAATACREVCRRVVDFERDHPAYPAFLDSLLLAARRRSAAGTVRVAGAAGADCVVRERGEGSPNSSAAVLAVDRGILLGGVALSHAGLKTLRGDQRQSSQLHAGPRAATATATAPGTPTPYGRGVPNRHTRMEAPTAHLANNGQQRQRPLPGAPSASPAPLSTPVDEDEVRIAVTSEKALGAAMTAAAKGPGGGEEAAAMLLLEGVEVRRNAGGR